MMIANFQFIPITNVLNADYRPYHANEGTVEAEIWKRGWMDKVVVPLRLKCGVWQTFIALKFAPTFAPGVIEKMPITVSMN